MTGLDLQWARLGTNVWLHNSNRNEVVRPNLPTKKDMKLAAQPLGSQSQRPLGFALPAQHRKGGSSNTMGIACA